MKHFFLPFNSFPFIYCNGLLFDCMEGMGLLPLATKMITLLSADKAVRSNASFPTQSCVNSNHAWPGYIILFSPESKSQFCCSLSYVSFLKHQLLYSFGFCTYFQVQNLKALFWQQLHIKNLVLWNLAWEHLTSW